MLPAEGDYALLSTLGIHALLPSDSRTGWLRSAPFRGARLSGGNWRKFLNRYGLVDTSDVEGFIDLSGFRLSDQWGVAPATALAKLTRRYGRRDAPIVFLPQAFGPFHDAAVARSAARAIAPASVVFTRDPVSAEHLAGLGTATDIRVAPDLTLFGVSADRLPDGDRAPVTIVPNARLLDRPGHFWTHDGYIGALRRLSHRVHSHGLPVSILVHTTEPADAKLGQRLVEQLDFKVDVVVPRSGLEAKQRLSSSWAVVGSRFHALAGALSTGRPAVGLGWTHKYQALFDDFGVSDFLIGPNMTEQSADSLMEQILDPQSNGKLSRELTRQKERLNEIAEAMWRDVTSILA
jgi:polysaccharide pyruvyl transferase WcaK-like protein